jgi:hypothetical protein
VLVKSRVNVVAPVPTVLRNVPLLMNVPDELLVWITALLWASKTPLLVNVAPLSTCTGPVPTQVEVVSAAPWWVRLRPSRVLVLVPPEPLSAGWRHRGRARPAHHPSVPGEGARHSQITCARQPGGGPCRPAVGQIRNARRAVERQRATAQREVLLTLDALLIVRLPLVSVIASWLHRLLIVLVSVA